MKIWIYDAGYILLDVWVNVEFVELRAQVMEDLKEIGFSDLFRAVIRSAWAAEVNLVQINFHAPHDPELLLAKNHPWV